MSEPEFFVKAKTLNKQYKQQKYTLTFLPPTKHWKWEVTHVNVTKFGGEAKTLHAAQRAAEKHIDNTNKILGIK
jgi:hypothetical protein